MSCKIVLDVESIEGESERRVFLKPEITVGRNPNNDIAVTRRQRPGVHHASSTNCARQHGMLVLQENRLTLIDMGTTNGWHCLNDGTVLPGRDRGHKLEVGDCYYVGDTKITIVSFEGEP